MWWTIHLEGGPRRVNHAAVGIGERIFSFGGYCTGDNYKDERPIDVFVLNTLTYRWTEIPKPADDDPSLGDWPYQRYGHTVIAYNESIYLFGGRNDEAACNVLYKFDTNTYKWSKPAVQGDIPGERDGHSACVIGQFMYVFGGYEEIIERFGQDVYRLDLATYTWKLLVCIGEPPVHRDFHSATAIGTNMFIFGGRSDLTGGQGWQVNMGPDYYSNKVCYFDTTTYTWHNPNIQPNLPSGRRSHSALNLDGKLLIFGGYNGRTKEHKNDIWLLDPETWTWKQVKTYCKGPNPRRRQALCRVGDRIFLFGGTSPYNGPPLYFTPEQLALLPQQEEDSTTKLMDHNDLYVLDLNPSLKTLCLLAVIQNRLNTTGLPKTLLNEIRFMSTNNVISKPLRTVESLPTG
jgi:N-acetylneuraminic acid mutarotase